MAIRKELLESIAQLEAGKGIMRDLIEVDPDDVEVIDLHDMSDEHYEMFFGDDAEPTLEQLLAEFEDIRAPYQWNDIDGLAMTVDEWATHVAIINGPIDSGQRWFGTVHLPIAEAALRYVKARDEEELEFIAELGALEVMLNNLSDGAHDPRKGVA